jgi:hypothetical protein
MAKREESDAFHWEPATDAGLLPIAVNHAACKIANGRDLVVPDGIG